MTTDLKLMPSSGNIIFLCSLIIELIIKMRSYHLQLHRSMPNYEKAIIRIFTFIKFLIIFNSSLT